MNLLSQTLLLLFIPVIFCQFVLYPDNPKIGESIFLKCRLNAPANHKFISTSPELKVNDSNPFTCERLSEVTGNPRFHGGHNPDYLLTILSCDIAILFLKESDLGTTFTCYQKLDNYTIIAYSITLAITSTYSTYSTFQTTNLVTSTLVATTLEHITSNSLVTTKPTDSTQIGMGFREMVITIIVLTLCLCCYLFTSLISFISLGLYFIRRSLSSRNTQYSVDPEIPKSKKDAINENLLESSIELQGFSSPERGQEENPQTFDASP